MPTIEEIYSKLFNIPEKWDYYNIGKKTQNPFKSKDYETCSNFIQNYIKRSEKNSPELIEFIKNLNSRSLHTVSTFFLGIYLYKESDLLRENIDEELMNYRDSENNRMNFSYVWFLICFFHDIGYQVERKKLKYKSFQDFFQKECKDLELPKVDGVPDLYADIYSSYFDYRIEKHGVNDHGIFAAHILFRDLCKIREEKNKDHSQSLHWGEELIKVFSFASWIVLAHNIWYIKDNDDKCLIDSYERSNLHQLIRKEKEDNKGYEYKISFKDYPTFFLFCIVDSIEFLKRIQNVDCLKSIKLDIEDSKNNCKIIIAPNLSCRCCKEKVIKACKKLEDWLIPVTEDDGTIIIEIKNETQIVKEAN